MNDISIPPWLTGDLIIGILVLIVAVIGVLIAYRELKPGLRVRVIRCRHKVRYVNLRREQEGIAGTELIVDFEIGNTGGPTSIYEIEIRCKPLRTDYHTTESIQGRGAIPVAKGNMERYTHQFYIPRRGVFESPLSCTFFLHHAHGKKKTKANSTLREGAD